eukprot:scaffold55315_cov29-Tisochrysis_lutea.AAC.5
MLEEGLPTECTRWEVPASHRPSLQHEADSAYQSALAGHRNFLATTHAPRRKGELMLAPRQCARRRRRQSQRQDEVLARQGTPQ